MGAGLGLCGIYMTTFLVRVGQSCSTSPGAGFSQRSTLGVGTGNGVTKDRSQQRDATVTKCVIACDLL